MRRRFGSLFIPRHYVAGQKCRGAAAKIRVVQRAVISPSERLGEMHSSARSPCFRFPLTKQKLGIREVRRASHRRPVSHFHEKTPIPPLTAPGIRVYSRPGSSYLHFSLLGSYQLRAYSVPRRKAGQPIISLDESKKGVGKERREIL